MKNGPGVVTGRDIQSTDKVEVLNPEQHIATLGGNAKFTAELMISYGRGFVAADESGQELPVGYIGVDALIARFVGSIIMFPTPELGNGQTMTPWRWRFGPMAR